MVESEGPKKEATPAAVNAKGNLGIRALEACSAFLTQGLGLLIGGRQRWDLYQAKTLRREVEVLIQQLGDEGKDVKIRCAIALASRFYEIETDHGTLAEIPKKEQRAIARQLHREGYNSVHMATGDSYGLLLLGAHVKAHTLSSDDAKSVLEGTGRILGLARPLQEKHLREQAAVMESIRRIAREPARAQPPVKNVVPFGPLREADATASKRPQ